MKIAIDARYIGKSGIGTYIDGILHSFIKHYKEHSYLVITSNRQMILSFSNVKVLYTDIQPFSLKELFCFPTKEINKCDAFFTPYINIPSGIKVPIYSTIHDVIFLDVKGLTSKVGYLIRKLYVWRAIRLSKAIFTVSEFSKGRIQYHFHTKKDIKVINNGITNKLKDYKPINIIKKDYFIYVGNVKQHKGIDLLLNAYKKARDKGLKSKLYIVGEYNNFRSSADLSELIDDKENIKFTGRVSDEELYFLVSEAKALVLPSRYEGFGLPPLESLYLGTNAIISDIPAMKEIYKDLPVTFFKSNNVEDLIKSLLSYQAHFDVKEVRKTIDRKYNFALSAKHILDKIEQGYEY